MWRLSSRFTGTAVYSGQRVSLFGSTGAAIQVKNIYVNGRPVSASFFVGSPL
jgi:hypothetical protein